MKVVKDLSLVEKGEKVFVQFGASWCAPCKAMTSYIESSLEEKFGSVSFVKIDIEDCDQELLKVYEVRSVPKVVIFDGGSVVTSFVGFNKEKITNSLI